MRLGLVVVGGIGRRRRVGWHIPSVRPELSIKTGPAAQRREAHAQFDPLTGRQWVDEEPVATASQQDSVTVETKLDRVVLRVLRPTRLDGPSRPIPEDVIAPGHEGHVRSKP
jgi:hypothetical protein